MAMRGTSIHNNGLRGKDHASSQQSKAITGKYARTGQIQTFLLRNHCKDLLIFPPNICNILSKASTHAKVEDHSLLFIVKQQA